MNLALKARQGLLACAVALAAALPALTSVSAEAAPAAQGQSVRVVGVVRDDANAIPLPGVPVEVVGTPRVVYTDVDGRFVIDVAPGMHQLKVLMEGYREKLIN